MQIEFDRSLPVQVYRSIKRNRVGVLIAASLTLVVSAFILIVPPIAQDETYHCFADSRAVWGIPNFWNVASNLPFAMMGILGLWKLRSVFDRVLFVGVLLTFFGSAYYHLAPSDARLVWDRLPMTLVFMALLACVVTGADDSRFSRWLLASLVACGAASVLWWIATNDLRFYVLVQFGPLLILVPALWIVHDARYLAAALTFYWACEARRILRSRHLREPAGQRPHHEACPGRGCHVFHFSLASGTRSERARTCPLITETTHELPVLRIRISGLGVPV